MYPSSKRNFALPHEKTDAILAHVSRLGRSATYDLRDIAINPANPEFAFAYEKLVAIEINAGLRRGHYQITDGHHRIAAAIFLGKPKITSIFEGMVGGRNAAFPNAQKIQITRGFSQ